MPQVPGKVHASRLLGHEGVKDLVPVFGGVKGPTGAVALDD